MRKKILVVGGAGYVGDHVVDLLVNTDYEVAVYDNLLYDMEYRKRDVEFIFGDVRDYKKLNSIIHKFDVVIWLAAIVGDEACRLNMEITKQVNVNSVHWLNKYYKGRIIFLSTCSVYGKGSGSEDLKEHSELKPQSYYAKTKLVAEGILENKALIFRLGTLFGSGGDFSRVRMDLVLNIMVKKAIIDKCIYIYGGEQYRPLLHVKDVGYAIWKNVENNEIGIYNLNSQNVQIKNLAIQVKNHFPDIKLEYKEIDSEDKRNYRVSSDKVKEKLNIQCKRTVDEGIYDIEYLLKYNRIKDIENSRYSNKFHLEQLIMNGGFE